MRQQHPQRDQSQRPQQNVPHEKRGCVRQELRNLPQHAVEVFQHTLVEQGQRPRFVAPYYSATQQVAQEEIEHVPVKKEAANSAVHVAE